MSEEIFYSENKPEETAENIESNLEDFEIDLNGLEEQALTVTFADELKIDDSVSLNNVIGSPDDSGEAFSAKPSNESNDNGIVTSIVKTVDSSKLKNNIEEKKEKVAVFSSRNVTWSGVGKVYRGYNIVDKGAADKWLTRDHIRLATPEEVAEEFKK